MESESEFKQMNLARSYYFQIGTTQSNILKLLPVAKGKQNVLIGDEVGSVGCYEFKSDEIITIFKTPPQNKEITRLEIASSLKGEKDERIFFSQGSMIRGVTKKGKIFLEYKAQVAETIKSFKVEENRMWIGCEYIYNELDNLKDVAFKIIEGKINDMTIVKVVGDMVSNAVLGCSDNLIRIMHGEDILYQVPVQGPVKTITNFISNDGKPTRGIIYGTENGYIAAVWLERNQYQQVWQIPPKDHAAGVTCISLYDINRDGVLEMVITRDNGNLEVYSLDYSKLTNSPDLKYQTCLEESITSLCLGCVVHLDVPDILLTTYSGKVIGLADPQSQTNTKLGQKVSKDKRIIALKKEVDKLTQRLAEAKQQYNLAQQESNSQQQLPASFKVFNKMVLLPEEAAYYLVIESQVPIEIILLQSKVFIELLEEEQSSSGLYCKYEEEGNINQGFKMVYRTQSGSVTRVDFKLRTAEGAIGEILLYVIPTVAPKTAQIMQIKIKPLSLHQKSNVPLQSENYQLSQLKVVGNFTFKDIHNWINNCLPDVPSLSGEENEMNLQYQSSFIGTVAFINYSRGQCEVRSDNISTLAIIKESISNDATIKNITLNISYDVNPQSFPHILGLLDTKLQRLHKVQTSIMLVDALKELQQSQEQDTEDLLAILSPDLKEICENQEQLRAEFKQHPRKLRYIHGIISDLYADKAKFAGLVNIQAKIPELLQILSRYTLQSLIEFFMRAY